MKNIIEIVLNQKINQVLKTKRIDLLEVIKKYYELPSEKFIDKCYLINKINFFVITENLNDFINTYNLEINHLLETLEATDKEIINLLLKNVSQIEINNKTKLINEANATKFNFIYSHVNIILKDDINLLEFSQQIEYFSHIKKA